MSRALGLIVALGLMIPNLASARPIQVDKSLVTATSVCDESEGVNYDAKNIVDNKLTNAWVEGETGSGLGSFVTLDLGVSQVVTGLRIWNGYWISGDFWQRHNRMKDIEVEFSDGTKQTFTLKDEMVPETITLPKAVNTSSIKLKFKSVYAGNTFQDTVISEIQVLDTRPDDHFVPASATASTTYPADGDSSYDATLTYDGMVDTMWCEDNKTGDGTNEWIEWNFGNARPISKVTLNNGNAGSLSVNMKSNKALKAKLSFDDGSTAEITLKPSPSTQVITFPARTTSKVRMTILGVQKGSDPAQNDLCISEARFAE